MTTRESAAAFARAFSGEADEPDVWAFNRRAPGFLRLAEVGPLSDDDRARADKLLDPDSGTELLARRAAVRHTLGLYLGRSPESVRTVTFPGGKPAFVPETGDRFTLSFSYGYSGDLFCMTVGTSESLGLDVEKLRPVPRAGGIAQRWFSDAETEVLEKASPEERGREFMKLWTGKEALAKRHAAGLRLMSRRGLDLGSPELDVLAELSTRRLVNFEPTSGYVVAVASARPVARVRLLANPVFDT